MVPARVLLGASIAWLGAGLAPVSAQTDVTVEFGAARIGPAVGSEGSEARFAMGGLRASIHGRTGSSLVASVLGGRLFGDSTGGSFVSGMLEGRLADQWTSRWSGGIDVTLLGLGAKNPFPYRMYSAELGPYLAYRAPSASVRIGAVAGVGWSRLELWRVAGGLTRVFHDSHARVGTTGEVLVGSANLRVGIAGSVHDASGEGYRSVGGRLLAGGDWGVVEVRADRWRTPLGPETTGGVAVSIPLGGAWTFRGFFGRSDPDPLTLTQPGSGSAGAVVGWSLYTDAAARTSGVSPFEVIEHGASRSKVRIEIEAPEGASRVDVLGDFTLWDPHAMRREGSRWIVELEVAVGTHHYGFLVDGAWYLPDDTPNSVPDEWGRKSATLVIEGAPR